MFRCKLFAAKGDGMSSLQAFIAAHRKSEEKRVGFVQYLYALMEKHRIEKTSDIYTKANITKQAWSKIISGKSYPSLNTCIKIAFAMRLSNHECKYLLKKAGYTLASSSIFALIIRYCFENQIYDLCQVNDYLTEYGYDDFFA